MNRRIITLPSKKFFLSLAVFLIIALSIPVTVFLVRQRQELRTKAQTYTFTEDFLNNNFKDNTATTAWWNNPSAPGVLQLPFSGYSSVSMQDQSTVVTPAGEVIVGWSGHYKISFACPSNQTRAYSQKLTSDGIKTWSPFYMDNQLNVRDDYCTLNGGYAPASLLLDVYSPAVILDPQGNTYYAFYSGLDETGVLRVRLQKLNPSGKPLFSDDLKVNVGNLKGLTFDTAVTTVKIGRDLAGNIYVAWGDFRNWSNGDWANVYLQKFDADGNRLWAQDARVTPSTDMSRSGGTFDIAVTPSGDVYAAWMGAGGGIYLQKVSSGGQRQWTNSTRVNVSAPGGNAANPRVSWSETDQSLYVTWFYWPSADSNPIYLNKVKPDGQVAWGTDLKVNKDTNFTNASSDVAADSQGNAYVTWGQVGGVGMGQKVDPSGKFLWESDVNLAPSVPRPAVDPANNNLYVTFSMTNRNGVVNCPYAPGSVVGGSPASCIFAQKYDPSGNKIWTSNVQVSRVGEFLPTALGQSTTADTVDWNIASATLTAEQIFNGRMDKYIPALADGTIQYYLSNDGGTTWEKVDSGVSHNFTLTGSDLRWKADLATPELSISPIVDKITIVYGQEGVTPLIPTITPTNTPTPIPTPTPTIPPGAPTPTPTPTPTPGPIVTLTPTPTPTPTMALVSTPVPTRVITLTPTPTPTPALPQAGSIAPTIGFILGGLILVGLSLLLVF